MLRAEPQVCLCALLARLPLVGTGQEAWGSWTPRLWPQPISAPRGEPPGPKGRGPEPGRGILRLRGPQQSALWRRGEPPGLTGCRGGRRPAPGGPGQTAQAPEAALGRCWWAWEAPGAAEQEEPGQGAQSQRLGAGAAAGAQPLPSLAGHPASRPCFSGATLPLQGVTTASSSFKEKQICGFSAPEFSVVC